MACPDRLSPWTKEVSTAFAHLSKPQLRGLVLWSAGIALSGVAGITFQATGIAQLLKTTLIAKIVQRLPSEVASITSGS